ncbi:MAG: fumarylacetoacetate hydrolase family protein [Oligoflexales bacterium]
MSENVWFKDTKNIYCIGRNYTEHAKELNNPIPNNPLIFLKSPAALRSLEPVEMAFAGETYDYESELVLVMKDHLELNTRSMFTNLAGICIGLDLTRRDVQSELKSKGHPWALAKNFKGSAILGKVASLEKITSQTNIEFTFYVNGEVKQHGHSHNMIFSLLSILDSILKSVELFPNDLIFTGTPKGVGKVEVGDHLRFVSPTLEIDESGYL